MAKPTVRIPEWASSGARTDPGASKEAVGWNLSERPPAEWWNWLDNARDQWMAYVAQMIPLSVLRIDVGSAPSALVDWSIGRALTSVTLTGGDANIQVLFADDICTAIDNTVVHASTVMVGGADIVAIPITFATDEINISVYDSGSLSTWGASGITGELHVTIWGDSP